MRAESSAASALAATAVAGALLLSGSPSQAPAQETPAGPQPAAQGSSQATTHSKLREGTRISDRDGSFRLNGESAVFVTADGRELGTLPNLNLERVLRLLKTVDEPERVTWSVSGEITEFSNRNYLLVSRAVYRASLSAAAEASNDED